MSIYHWPSPGCVGLWRFESNGTDGSPEGNDGTASSISYAIGRFGKRAGFDAASPSYFSMTYADSLKVADLTVMAWYKGTDAAARATLFCTSGIHIGSSYDTYYGYNFETRTGMPALMLRSEVVAGETAVNDGAWHWLAATRDDDYARVYVDGKIDAELASPTALSYCSHAPASYYYACSRIGGSYRAMAAPSTIGNYPTCSLDELQVLNYALSPAQVRRMYAFQRGFL
ncbi:LamG domain-containing protein [Candidatus Pacearchaeota archaeon]|nr:LamG domain-containing protein [Candidatus Pacearchaeota archaeon]